MILRGLPSGWVLDWKSDSLSLRSARWSDKRFLTEKESLPTGRLDGGRLHAVGATHVSCVDSRLRGRPRHSQNVVISKDPDVALIQIQTDLIALGGHQ